MSEETSGLLVLNDRPPLRNPTMVAAFAGWPDAGEVATGSLRYLVAKLNARRLGHIEPDSFYDYGTARPLVSLENGVVRSLRHPSSELFYWMNPDEPRDLVILLAAEPQLRWRQYVRLVAGLARSLGVELFVGLGGLFDTLPHTATPRVSGLATGPAMRARLLQLEAGLSNYQGPSSIHTSLMLACQDVGVESVSLWGHAPHYVRTVANPKVCHALLTRVAALADVSLELSDLKAAGEYLDETLNRMLGQHEELRLYVQKLEDQQGGQAEEEPEPSPGDTDRIIRDVEDFLRREGRGEDDQDP